MASKRRRSPPVNGLTTWLLRSPFSGLLDGSLILITVRGRRTGAEHTLPVQYASDGEAIWVLPAQHEHKTWWRNLVHEASVGLRLGGHDLVARAQAFSGEDAPALVEEGLQVYVRRFPAVARRFGLAKSGGSVDQGRLRDLAKRTVMVRVSLSGEDIHLVNRVAAIEGAASKGLIGWTRRHPLGAFYALTFLLSWGYWVPDAIFGGHLTHTPGLMGPLVAAFVITTAVEGKAGLRDLGSRLVRWRVPVRWYLAAALPLVLALGVAAIVALGPGGFPSLAKWVRMDGFPALGALGAFALILIVNAYGEESGWRGFALPRFRERHDELRASFLLFIPWVLWHVPTFFLDTGYRGFNLLFLPGFVIGVFAGAVVLTWLYEGARSSILIAALWHAFLNIGSATKAGEGAVAAALTVLVIVWSLVIARTWRRRDEAERSRTNGCESAAATRSHRLASATRWYWVISDRKNSPSLHRPVP